MDGWAGCMIPIPDSNSNAVNPTMRWVVCQLGARRNYLVPRLLLRHHLLAHLFTDIVGNQGWPSYLHWIPAKWLPGSLLRLRNRIPPEIPSTMVTGFPSFGMRYQLRASGVESVGKWNWGSDAFAHQIARHPFEAGAGVYTFTGAALKLQQRARREGRCNVLDQIMAPRVWEQRILREEEAQFPFSQAESNTSSSNATDSWKSEAANGERPSPPFQSDEYCQRQREEWELADAILCGSQFVIDTLMESGAESHKCFLVPSASGTPFPCTPRQYAGRPLRVLTVGAVGLRKGSWYVVQAAKRMASECEFRLVGKNELNDSLTQEAKGAVTLMGVVPRNQMLEHYQWADVMLLPSLCEGSSGATYEAMSAGLPVVCTHNTGSVVEDGRSGYIIPIRDVETICQRLTSLAENREQLAAMSLAAIQRSAEFSQESYGSRLVACLHQAACSGPTKQQPNIEKSRGRV